MWKIPLHRVVGGSTHYLFGMEVVLLNEQDCTPLFIHHRNFLSRFLWASPPLVDTLYKLGSDCLAPHDTHLHFGEAHFQSITH